MILGRDQEMRMLGGLLESVRTGGGAAVLRGEPGIGKSALLAEMSLVAAAEGLLVLTTAGVQSETRVAFAGLHQLLRPVLGHVDRLAEPQRRALRAALGETAGDVPDLFLTALATLNLVTESADQRPVLLVVDDAHWLDPPSAEVLAFVARRLAFEPVVFLAALRDGFPGVLDTAGLPDIGLGRLDGPTSAAVLDARAPGLPAAVRERVLDQAAGNPLALVELPAVVEAYGDGTVAEPWLPLTTRLEQAFAARVSGLPAAARKLLLVLALNDGDALAETLAATSSLAGTPVTVDDLTPAAEARLIEVTGHRVRLRHPLMRSAIHQQATVGERHAVHTALARILTLDADRRVWHRAAACSEPDEEVAADLEAAASRAQIRGGVDTAVAALERAAALSGDPVSRGRRLLRAAELAVELGRRDVVVRLLGEATGTAESEDQRTRMAWIRESFDDGVRDPAAGARSLADLAARVAGEGDTALALKLLWGAALRCFWTEPGAEARAQVVAAAEQVRVDEDDARLLAILAFVAPIERGARVVATLRRAAQAPVADAQTARLLGDAATLVGAFDLAARFCAAALPEFRSQGRLGLLARALAAQSWSSVHLGDLTAAIPAAEEASALARETMQPVMHATARVTEAMLAALRGEEQRALDLAAEAQRATMSAGVRPVLASVQHARGLAALGAGRYDEAYGHLCRMYEPTDAAYHLALRCYAVGDLVEAAVRSGQGDAVRDVVAELESIGERTPSPALHAGLRHARALLAGDATAEPLYDAAVRADLPGWPYTTARAQLAYGGWLRRQRRAAESRALLRAARDTFDALGAIPWGERARQELRASGETSRGRTPDARDWLTPQELQIAQLAATGLTNREIGQRLYLSHRTISSHLHRIFPKLAITSRSELGPALSAVDR
jgi:DNA-binding CsgD family transcriptional regulator